MEIINFTKERDIYVISPFTGADFTVKERDLINFITDERLNESHYDDDLVILNAVNFLEENPLDVIREYFKNDTRDMLIDFRNKFVAYNQVERFQFNDVNTMKRASIVLGLIILGGFLIYLL